MDDIKMGRSRNFQYTHSIIQDDKELVKDIMTGIKVGWMKWWEASEVLRNGKIPFQLKGKFYRGQLWCTCQMLGG